MQAICFCYYLPLCTNKTSKNVTPTKIMMMLWQMRRPNLKDNEKTNKQTNKQVNLRIG